MDKIYQEILEAIELKKENDAKIAELKSKISDNEKTAKSIENSIDFSMDKDSMENKIQARKRQNLDIENGKMNLEKQRLEDQTNGKIDEIKAKLQSMIAEERAKLEDNENKYEENVTMENWNSFYNEEVFENAKSSEVGEKSFEILENIKKMENVYNQLSSKDIEKLAKEAEENSKGAKIEDTKTVKQQTSNKDTVKESEASYIDTLQEKLVQRNQKLQEEHIKETRTRICKDVFAKKEKGFEDLLIPEYKELKNAILDLVDKDPDGLRKIMYKISDMPLEDVYKYLIKGTQEAKDEDRVKNIKEGLRKIEARREELNPKKEETKKDEPKKEEPKKDDKRRGELERRLRRVFGAKEKRFEDLIIDEYLFLKEDMFKLLDKDLDGLEKVLNQMRNMKLSDIYRSMLTKAKEQGKEDKAQYISEILDKTTEREAEIEKESKEKTKQEEELKNLGNKDSKAKKDESKKDESKKDESKKDESKKDESKKDEAKKDEPKKDEPKKDEPKKVKPYEKTTIEVDTQHNIIVICAKGKTEPYRVSNSDDIKKFIKNGKEYKKDKEYKKLFDKKALKKADPVLLGILVDVGDMDAAKEYVNAFKSENATSIDLKYTFGAYYEANVPMTTINNYERFAKKAEKSADATVEGLKKGPIGRFMDWRNARKAKKLEAAKEGKPTFGEKVQTYLFDEFGEERNEKIAEYKKAKQENKAKNNFKDEMKKDVPTPEEQAKTAKEFGEKQKAEKREPKARRNTTEKVK